MSLIKKPFELEIQTSIKALIYGQPGLGKSTMGLSAPKPVLLDFDNGVHRVNSAHQVDTLQVTKWQEVIDVLNSGELKNYESIVIDTAGKMLDYLSIHLIEKNPKLGKANGALSLQGYGERKSEFNQFLKRVALMGKHLIFIAHEKEEKQGDETYKRPEVGGSSGTDLYKELDLIGYMEANGKKRTISFAPTDKFYAKNSCGLTEVIEFPEIKEGEPNNFFTKHVIDTYKQSLSTRKEKVEAYTELMDIFEAKIESANDAESLNEVLSFINDYKEHIWSSKIQAGVLLMAKSKNVTGVAFDKTSKTFVAEKEPANV